jgi:hypothetical protein
MRNSTYNLFEGVSQNHWSEEARRQEKAYSLLREGLVRFEETEEVLDASALAEILPFREKLVLSSREHWLLDKSQEFLRMQKVRRRTRIKKIVLASLALGLLVFQPWQLLSTKDREGRLDKQPAAAQPVRAVQASSQGEQKISEAQWRSIGLLPEQQVVDTPDRESGVLVTLPAPENEAPEQTAAPVTDPKSNFSVVIPVRTREGEVWRVRKAGEWGLANPEGEVLLPLEFRRVRVLHEAQGYFILEDGSRRGIATATGRVLLPPVYDELGAYDEASELLVVTQKNRSGVFNLRKQQMVIEPEFLAIRHFSEGLFGIQSTEGKWGFADVNGQIVIQAFYDAIVEPFREGLALVTLNGENFYIDREGDVLLSRR